MAVNYIVILLVVILFHNGVCQNSSDYLRMTTDKFQTKQSRLLTFETQENGDINMEIAFNVPFIRIPVKKSIDMASGAIANVNIGAVILAGAIAFGFAVVIPGILALFTKKGYHTGYRNDDSTQSTLFWSYLTRVDQALSENNIDSTSCMQRMICWSVKNSSMNVLNGQSSSNDKIIDGLATNSWINRITQGTAINEAIQKGLEQVNCSQIYRQCNLTQKNLQLELNTWNA